MEDSLCVPSIFLFAGEFKTKNSAVTVKENSNVTVLFTVDSACQNKNSALTDVKVIVNSIPTDIEVCGIICQNGTCYPSLGCTYDPRSQKLTATRDIGDSQGETWILSVQREGCELFQQEVQIQVKGKS